MRGGLVSFRPAGVYARAPDDAAGPDHATAPAPRSAALRVATPEAAGPRVRHRPPRAAPDRLRRGQREARVPGSLRVRYRWRTCATAAGGSPPGPHGCSPPPVRAAGAAMIDTAGELTPRRAPDCRQPRTRGCAGGACRLDGDYCRNSSKRLLERRACGVDDNNSGRAPRSTRSEEATGLGQGRTAIGPAVGAESCGPVRRRNRAAAPASGSTT